jgi:hypothetical protein
MKRNKTVEVAAQVVLSAARYMGNDEVVLRLHRQQANMRSIAARMSERAMGRLARDVMAVRITAKA